jgi:hypothetical protein
MESHQTSSAQKILISKSGSKAPDQASSIVAKVESAVGTQAKFPFGVMPPNLSSAMA